METFHAQERQLGLRMVDVVHRVADNRFIVSLSNVLAGILKHIVSTLVWRVR